MANKNKRVVALDADVWGFAAAGLCGTIVMAAGFWRDIEGLTIAVRVGLTFVVTYAAVFVLVRLILRTALTEIAELKRQEREKQAKARQAEAGAAGAAPGMEGREEGR